MRKRAARFVGSVPGSLIKTMEFYRYEAEQYAVIDHNGDFTSPSICSPHLALRTFPLIKETPKGYWVGRDWLKKWVSKTATKRYAYPTKEEALNNFIKRTERRVSILKAQLEWSEKALSAAQHFDVKTGRMSLAAFVEK